MNVKTMNVKTMNVKTMNVKTMRDARKPHFAALPPLSLYGTCRGARANARIAISTRTSIAAMFRSVTTCRR